MKRIILFTLVLVTISVEVEAATFNYIFNNVEQGDNSTTSPSIVVDGEKITKKNGEVVSTSSAESEIPMANPEARRALKYRLMALGSMLSNYTPNNISLKSTGQEVKGMWKERSSANATIAGSVFVGRDLALGGFWANQNDGKANYGAEAEFIPARIEVLGKYDFIETGILLGASTIGRDYLGKGGTFHGGVRASVNFLPQLGITAAIRSNINERSKYRYTMAEAGLAYRF